MMETSSINCMICGADLKYTPEHYKKQCYYCKEISESNAECENGHYVCDKCHSSKGNEFIKRYCNSSDSTNPILMAQEIMQHSSINMHGPEHHYLVPAVLITAYYNKTGYNHLIAEKLDEAERRVSNISGGFCGFYGACGASIGTGIFMSLINNTTPLSKESWQTANMITAQTLYCVAKKGGPRCCKRTVYIALQEANKFISENLHIELCEGVDIICKHHQRNKECIGKRCDYFVK